MIIGTCLAERLGFKSGLGSTFAANGTRLFLCVSVKRLQGLIIPKCVKVEFVEEQMMCAPSCNLCTCKP